jgi:hypothetical protein
MGQSREAVIAELGQPTGTMQFGTKEILMFKAGSVTLQNGVVLKTDISQENVQQADERALQAEETRQKKLAAKQQQQQLYPENKTSRVSCTYSKTDHWQNLPKTLTPAHGPSQYLVYIPEGYYESDVYSYPVLFVESPSFWEGVKERIKEEKWIAIILPVATDSQTGKTMNKNFLAAYDDATTRFRLSTTRKFIAGSLPTSIFATLRKVDGIILQEPGFQSLVKVNYIPNFLSKNRNLHAFIILGKQNSTSSSAQMTFITDKIPSHQFCIYNGYTTTLPQKLANCGIDWLKTQCLIP